MKKLVRWQGFYAPNISDLQDSINDFFYGPLSGPGGAECKLSKILSTSFTTVVDADGDNLLYALVNFEVVFTDFVPAGFTPNLLYGG